MIQGVEMMSGLPVIVAVFGIVAGSMSVPIAGMIKKADSRASWVSLRASYKKLTGKDFK
jgi:hypothetical protein